MRFASAAQLAQTQLARADEVSRMAKEEHEAFVRLMEDEHRMLVSGNIPAKTLRALGHPFARRHAAGLTSAVRKARRKNLMGAMRIRTLPINVQTDRLRSSLFAKKIDDRQTAQSFQVGFSAPHAKYVLAKRGTRRMIERRFIETKQQIEKRRERELRQRIRYGIVQIHAQTLR